MVSFAQTVFTNSARFVPVIPAPGCSGRLHRANAGAYLEGL